MENEQCVDLVEEQEAQQSPEIPLTQKLSEKQTEMLPETQQLFQDEKVCADILQKNQEDNSLNEKVSFIKKYSELTTKEKQPLEKRDPLLTFLKKNFLYSIIISMHLGIISELEASLEMNLLEQLYNYNHETI